MGAALMCGNSGRRVQQGQFEQPGDMRRRSPGDAAAAAFELRDGALRYAAALRQLCLRPAAFGARERAGAADVTQALLNAVG